jgi:hypothetical protein
MKFSERTGVRPVKLQVQVGTVSTDLRNRLWNILHLFYFEPKPHRYLRDESNLKLLRLFIKLWNFHFKKPIDEIPSYSEDAIMLLRKHFFECEWFEVYELLEAVSDYMLERTLSLDFNKSCNRVLEEELSGYRFVSGKIVEINAKESVDAIESAIAQTSVPFPTAAQHLQAAISLLARKPNPDYRNTIKESISAVEALCRAVTGESHGTLGKALKTLDLRVHPALRAAFEKLYGYTSDADGIRHALMAEENLRQEDALFMLVACSAFVGYIVAKTAKKS